MAFAIPSFKVPGELYVRRGSLALARQLRGRRAAIVCGARSFAASGNLVRLEGLLQAAGLESRLFDGFQGEPTLEAVRELGAALTEFAPDWIVAVGGGAVIDTARGGWVHYEHPEIQLDPGAGSVRIPRLRNRARLLAVPTTSGSGAEMSGAMVLLADEGRCKVSIFSPWLIPDVAVIDSALADGLPAELVAMTGFDAITHALEGYVSALHGSICDGLAVHALRRLMALLPRWLANPADREARDGVHVAASIAGVVQANVYTGLTHAFSHAFGPRFGIPHGRSSAVFAIAVMEYNMRSCDRYEELARALGLAGAHELLVALFRLRAELGLPETLEEAGADPIAVQRERETLLGAVRADACARTNPCRATPHDLQEILGLVSHQPELGDTAVLESQD